MARALKMVKDEAAENGEAADEGAPAAAAAKMDLDEPAPAEAKKEKKKVRGIHSRSGARGRRDAR